MQLAETTWTDADAADPDVVLLPVGATEQHGPHAPLSTDSLNAEAVAAAGTEHYDGRALVTPTLHYGVSEEHRRFAGTLWLTPDTFRAAISDVIRSLVSHGWRRVVIVNGHGGNSDALREVAGSLSRNEVAYTVSFTWFEVVVDPAEMGHAGPAETALLRYHHPDLVREERVSKAREGAGERWGEWAGGVNLAHETAEFTESGVIGDPDEGDAELGEDLTDRSGAALAEVMEAVAERDLDWLPND